MVLRGGFLLIACLLLSACKAELYDKLSQREANQMLAVLMGAGILAEKRAGTDDLLSIWVEKTQFTQATALLEARGMPENTFDTISSIFPDEGLVPTPLGERIRYIYALSQELSHTIGQIDGILSARVHVVVPETDILGRNEQTSSASVAIRHHPNTPVQAAIPNIKMLVANSIEGLVYDNVTVVNFPTEQILANDAKPLEFTQFLGVAVHPASLQRFQYILGGGVLIVLASLLFALFGVVRRNRAIAAKEVAEGL